MTIKLISLIKIALKRVPFVQMLVKRLREPNDFSTVLSNVSHNDILLFANGVAVPPIIMREKVRKGAILAEAFLIEGRQALDAILEILKKNKIEIVDNTSILEFGVGCGRIARHFPSLKTGNFTGSDIDPELVEWCNVHLGDVVASDNKPNFIRNDYLPPIALPDGKFDLIYSISVITHMNADIQLLWLKELHRLLKPKGHLLLSILEKSPSELSSGVQVVERIDLEFDRSWLGKNGAPAVYYNTYNTVSYLKDKLKNDFELIDVERKVIRNTQTLILLKRKI